jgi:hypothetical protein
MARLISMSRPSEAWPATTRWPWRTEVAVGGVGQVLEQGEPQPRILVDGIAQAHMALGGEHGLGGKVLPAVGLGAFVRAGDLLEGHDLHAERRGRVELGGLVGNDTHDSIPRDFFSVGRLFLKSPGGHRPPG